MNNMTANEYINGLPCLSEIAKKRLCFANDFVLDDNSRANLRVHIKMELEKMVNMYDARFND